MNNWQSKTMQLVVPLLSTVTLICAVVGIAYEVVFLLNVVETLQHDLQTMLLVRF